MSKALGLLCLAEVPQRNGAETETLPFTGQNIQCVYKHKWSVDMNNKEIQCHEQALPNKNNDKCKTVGKRSLEL